MKRIDNEITSRNKIKLIHTKISTMKKPHVEGFFDFIKIMIFIFSISLDFIVYLIFLQL